MQVSVPDSAARRRLRIQEGFARDDFLVKRIVDKDGSLGALAEHRSARIGTSSRAKRAFYLEGDNYQMGYLLGLLAADDIARMTGEFLQTVIFAFFDNRAAERRGISTGLRELIVHIATTVSRDVLPDVPPGYLREIQGIVDGCQAAGKGAEVTWDDLITLNLGFDALLSHVYSGKIFARRGYDPAMLRTPLGCNAFILSGDAAGGKCFFGRDFMFPTANVFQETACLMVCRPSGRPGQELLFVSQSAPGIVGSMTAMSSAGVAMGVNMLPTRFCSPERPGLNSLLLVRDCIQHCRSASEAVHRIAEAQRGVTWLYPVADSRGGAFIVEAGRKPGPREQFPYFTWVSWHYRRRLPSLAFIRRMRRTHGIRRPLKGIVERGKDYRLPDEYLTRWNRRLWNAFRGDVVLRIFDVIGDLAGIVVDLLKGRTSSLLDAVRRELTGSGQNRDSSGIDFSERGYINRSWKDKNCPGPFYFAPQREHRPDLLIATNHAISPEIRLTAMNDWIALLAGASLNEMQWRYDELNREILDAIDASPAGVTEDTAWELINFLRPDGRFPDFYNANGSAVSEVQVHGSITLCELAGRSMKSLYGYYGDEPVTVRLDNYGDRFPGFPAEGP